MDVATKSCIDPLAISRRPLSELTEVAATVEVAVVVAVGELGVGGENVSAEGIVEVLFHSSSRFVGPVVLDDVETPESLCNCARREVVVIVVVMVGGWVDGGRYPVVVGDGIFLVHNHFLT